MASVAQQSRVNDLLQTVLKTQPGEERRVGIMVLYSAAIGVANTVGSTVASALFLSQLDTSLTPFLFILPPIAMALTLLLYNRIAAAFDLSRLVMGSLSILILFAGIFRILLETPYSTSFILLAGLFLYMQVVTTLLFLQFWTFANQVFNPREGKRLFGLIATGQTVTNIFAGFTLGALSAAIGVSNLIYVVILAMCVCLACAAKLGKLQSENANVVPFESSEGNLRDDIQAIRHSPLLLALAGLAMLLAMLVNTGSFQFFSALQNSFQDDQRIVAFLGNFAFWTGILALFVQFYLTSRILNRFGVFAALLCLPVSMTIGALLGLFTIGNTMMVLIATTITRAANPVFRYTINEAGVNLLYLPISEALRQRAKTLFTAVDALSTAVLGTLFLLASLLNVPYMYWSVAIVFMALAWGALLWWTQPQYEVALQESLQRRVLNLEASTIDIRDEATVQVLVKALKDEDEFQVIHALTLIADAPRVDWDSQVIPLLKHPSPQVKILALQYLGRSEGTGFTEQLSVLSFTGQIALLFNADDHEVRAAAIEAFCGITGNRAISRIAPFLREDSPLVKGAAIVGLIKHGGLDGILQAAADLKDMLRSDVAAMRQEGARVLGRLGVQTFYDPLIPLFDDASLEVRSSAIRAAGQLRSAELMLHLVRKLSDKTTASVAVEALTCYREEVLPTLKTVMMNTSMDSEENRSIRIQVPGILQRIGGRTAADILLNYLRDVDPSVRTAVYQALMKMRNAGHEVVISSDKLYDALMAEIREGYALRVLHYDLSRRGANPLLLTSLTTRQRQTLARIVTMLDLRYPRQQLGQVLSALEDASLGRRALAIELLDNVVERKIKDVLIPLIEAPTPQLLDISSTHFAIHSKRPMARLYELAHSEDTWLRACAIYQIGVLNLRKLRKPVLKALESSNALLRETALIACKTLLPSEEFATLLRSHAANANFPTVKHYAQEMLESLRVV